MSVRVLAARFRFRLLGLTLSAGVRLNPNAPKFFFRGSEDNLPVGKAEGMFQSSAADCGDTEDLFGREASLVSRVRYRTSASTMASLSRRQQETSRVRLRASASTMASLRGRRLARSRVRHRTLASTVASLSRRQRSRSRVRVRSSASTIANLSGRQLARSRVRHRTSASTMASVSRR